MERSTGSATCCSKLFFQEERISKLLIEYFIIEIDMLNIRLHCGFNSRWYYVNPGWCKILARYLYFTRS